MTNQLINEIRAIQRENEKKLIKLLRAQEEWIKKYGNPIKTKKA